MTVQEFYDWAKKHNYLDFEMIMVKIDDCGTYEEHNNVEPYPITKEALGRRGFYHTDLESKDIKDSNFYIAFFYGEGHIFTSDGNVEDLDRYSNQNYYNY